MSDPWPSARGAKAVAEFQLPIKSTLGIILAFQFHFTVEHVYFGRAIGANIDGKFRPQIDTRCGRRFDREAMHWVGTRARSFPRRQKTLVLESSSRSAGPSTTKMAPLTNSICAAPDSIANRPGRKRRSLDQLRRVQCPSQLRCATARPAAARPIARIRGGHHHYSVAPLTWRPQPRVDGSCFDIGPIGKTRCTP